MSRGGRRPGGAGRRARHTALCSAHSLAHRPRALLPRMRLLPPFPPTLRRRWPFVDIHCSCGHLGWVLPERFAQAAGWDLTLSALQTRLRCTACDHKGLSVRAFLRNDLRASERGHPHTTCMNFRPAAIADEAGHTLATSEFGRSLSDSNLDGVHAGGSVSAPSIGESDASAASQL